MFRKYKIIYWYYFNKAHITVYFNLNKWLLIIKDSGSACVYYDL